ncbi:MAG: DUF748 domain-containing protein [Rhodocyclaceae bacterium]
MPDTDQGGTRTSASRRLRGALKALGWLAGLVALWALAGYVVAPPMVQSMLAERLGEALDRSVSVRSVEIDPFALSVTVHGLAVLGRETAEPEVSFGELHADLELASIVRRAVVLDTLRITDARLRIVRLESGRYNFSDVVEKLLARRESEPTRFAIAMIEISGGAIEYDDRPVKQRHALTDLRFVLPRLSNLPDEVDADLQPVFEARLDGSPVSAGARVRPFAARRQALAEIRVKDLDLPPYLRRLDLPAKLRLVSGKLDAALRLSFAQEASGARKLDLAGTATLNRAKLTTQSGEGLASVPEASLALASWDVFAGSAVIERIALKRPALRLLRAADGSLAFGARERAAKSADTGAGEAKPGFVWRIEEARVDEGTIAFEDRSVAPAFASRLSPVSLVVRKLGNAPGTQASLDLDAKAEGGAAASHRGFLALAPLSAGGHVEVSGIEPARYAAYLGKRAAFRIERGRLRAQADYRWTAAGAGVRVTAGSAAVEDLLVRHTGGAGEALRLARLTVSGVELDSAARSLAIASVGSRDARLFVRRAADGRIDLARLAGGRQQAPAKDAAPWSVRIGHIDLAGQTVDFTDLGAAQPVRIAIGPLDLGVDGWSSEPGKAARFDLKARIGKAGRLALAGSLRAAPLRAEMKVDAGGIELAPFQPYLARWLRLAVREGVVSAKGALTVAAGRDGALGGSYRGSAGLSGLHAVVQDESDDLLSLGALRISGIDARYAPLVLHAEGIAIEALRTRAVIDAQGHLNLARILRRETREEPAARGQPAADLRIGSIEVRDGGIEVEDHFIRPNYSASLSGLTGRVSGLSSAPGSSAEVELRGLVNGAAPLEIRGSASTLAADPALELRAVAKGIELPALTPYSAKYAGYAIDKGKLSATLHYKLSARKLEAENHLFLDQLTFGERVETPTATKLPVLLAVALLKNSRGEIDIDLPISGSLDDPQFSVGALIGRVLVNAVTKVVTAPFALLGKLFGGGEELSYAQFDPGSAGLTARARNRLEGLAKALRERPGLRLEIAGRYDAQRDTAGLKAARLRESVRAAWLAEPGRSKEEAAGPKPEEYAKYLTEAYRRAPFAKPRNAIGVAKDLPVEEIERLMLEHVEVGEQALHALAEARARAVRDVLLGEGRIPAERIFLVAPSAAGSGAQDAQRSGARVDFALR